MISIHIKHTYDEIKGCDQQGNGLDMNSTFSRLALKEMYCNWQGEFVFLIILETDRESSFLKEQSTVEKMEISLNSFVTENILFFF